ncbi:uncharacterized protein LAESUDRAFT_727627 [Laetiporus sulphureus 93-53]|uniref:Uncharacterized protein n=1 Tax=Laetiporus sulphureus 93-53 TaxID=1314785 RepID=A0A165DF49_9APHY|nr:uncharacterized protein LAESUDRAFT_727627 [Laetiporus sulphureus 93-53]KZT04755.1 hypothetical protein LAESUDRAFT_727627 [Laetiporus sulphureus 93-53]
MQTCFAPLLSVVVLVNLVFAAPALFDGGRADVQPFTKASRDSIVSSPELLYPYHDGLVKND